MKQNNVSEALYQRAAIQGLLASPIAYYWYAFAKLSYYQNPMYDLVEVFPIIIQGPIMALVFSFPAVALISIIDTVGSSFKGWRYYGILWLVATVAATLFGIIISIAAVPITGNAI